MGSGSLSSTSVSVCSSLGSFWVAHALFSVLSSSFLPDAPQLEDKRGELSIDRPIKAFEDDDCIIRRVPPVVLIFCLFEGVPVK